MLVLSRKQGERIVIGGNIEIIVTELSGNRVRVGVSAPPEVSIRRGELADFQDGRIENERELTFV